MKRQMTHIAVAILMGTCAFNLYASSHREAPSITKTPKVDATDFYMFNSYEAGRGEYVTLLANYQPLQDAFAGPNYYALDPNALYEIEIDNNGDAKEDITFQFKFQQTLKDLKVPVNGQMVSVPLSNIGAITNDSNSAQNTAETYSVTMVKGDRRSGSKTVLASDLKKPFDNVGAKSIPNYAQYARSFVNNISIPGCGRGRVFVGQRQDPFAVNLGQTFDLVNIAAPATEFNPNAESAASNSLAKKNVTTIALEVPKACLTRAGQPIIGAWTTASLRQGVLRNPSPGSDIQSATKEGGAWTQVSRLGMPLVNEVVIGLKDKDKFNASKPASDGQFATYVTNPTLPALVQILFGSAGVKAPTNFPRTDLVAAFLTGIPTLNKPANVVASEQLRLNTSIAAKPAAQQDRLGVINGDVAGFPNGRRPGDDVVDIALRVVMGKVCTIEGVNTAVGCKATDAPSGGIHFTDGALQSPTQFTSNFPYLNTPIAGSP
jgi:hypothetical protein